MERHIVLYNKIILCLKDKKITMVELSKKTNVKKQTISHRILNIKKRGIVDLIFLKQIEDVVGEKFLEV